MIGDSFVDLEVLCLCVISYLFQLSDISMPSILASSIFSAESGKTDMFYRSSNLLVLLCLTTGIFRFIFVFQLYIHTPLFLMFLDFCVHSSLGTINHISKAMLKTFDFSPSSLFSCCFVFSGLRSGCFAIANTILVSLL